MGIQRSVKSLEAEIKKLRQFAYKDELTGLLNRRGFYEEAEKFLHEVLTARGQKEKRHSLVIADFALVIFDIDFFKKLNDAHGHQAGDHGLHEVTETITDRVRDIDLVGRWGGEEIVVGLVGANEKDALRIADDIREKIATKKFRFRGHHLSITVSGGVATFDRAKNFDMLFEHADKALYKAKHTGRNRVIAWSTL